MLTFYLVRHGQTIFNVYRRMQGWCDTPLTAQGRRQARQLGCGFSDIPFLGAYSSSSGRAYETAQLILEHRPINIEPLNELREMFFGEKEGLPVTFAKGAASLRRQHTGWHDAGGEDLNDVSKRVCEALQAIALHHAEQDGNILIVSHGIAIMSVIYQIDPLFYHTLSDPDGTLKNCSLTRLEWKGKKFVMKDFNNMQYLEKGRIRYEKNHQ